MQDTCRWFSFNQQTDDRWKYLEQKDNKQHALKIKKPTRQMTHTTHTVARITKHNIDIELMKAAGDAAAPFVAAAPQET